MLIPNQRKSPQVLQRTNELSPNPYRLLKSFSLTFHGLPRQAGVLQCLSALFIDNYSEFCCEYRRFIVNKLLAFAANIGVTPIQSFLIQNQKLTYQIRYGALRVGKSQQKKHPDRQSVPVLSHYSINHS